MSENYVGSDIELVVTEAARAAVSQDKNMIDEQMLVDAVKKFTPSISPEEIDYYSNDSRYGSYKYKTIYSRKGHIKVFTYGK
jgi:SpoVK/Ycf46/Vps4 family AAA+-type ATPase